MIQTNKIKLSKGSNGRYILSKDAIQIIRKAIKLTVSYNRTIPSECYMMAEVEQTVYGTKYEITYEFPINVLEQQYWFRATVATESKHSLQMLLKPNCELIFIPSSDGVQDTIRYMISINGKPISGIFDQRVYDPSKNIRMVNIL